MVKKILIVLFLLCNPVIAGEDPVDLIKKKITKAETIYNTELAKAQLEIVKWLDGREATARKKGDKTTVNTIKQQREKLDQDGTIPKPCPFGVSRKVDTARDMLDASYVSLIKDALMANLDDLADEIDDKRTKLIQDKSDQNVFKLVTHMARNMVKNGDFESPVCNGAIISLQSPNTYWDTLYSKGGHICDYSKDSSQFLQWKNGTVVQKITGFIPGERYVLTYYVSALATPDQFGKTTFITRIGGEEEKFDYTVNTSGGKTVTPGSRGAPWEKHTIIFKAATEELELQIENSGIPLVQLDNVSVLPYLDN